MAENLFGTEIPANLNNNDGTPYTLGVRFTTLVAGTVTHIRWYRPTNAPGLCSFLLYRNDDSALIASTQQTISGSGAGWIEVALPNGGVAINTANTYTAAVFTPGPYTSTSGYAWPKNGTNLRSANPGGYYNGNFQPDIPTSEFGAANYFVDLVLQTATTTTPFTKDWTTTWRVQNAFTKDWATSWSIRSAFTKDWSGTWTIRAAFAKDYSTTWRVSNAWLKDHADTWRVRNAFAKDYADTWFIRNAWQKDWATAWRITNAWAADYSDAWRIRNAFAKDWADTYNVLSGTAWTKDWSDTWRVRNTFTKDYASTWRVLNAWAKDWSSTWAVRNSWQKDYATTWSILQDTAWFKEWSSTWRIRQGFLKDYVTTWRILDDTPPPPLSADVAAVLTEEVSVVLGGAVTAYLAPESVQARL